MHHVSFDFVATIVNCYTENDVPVIGIGDDPFEPEHYIVISQFIDDDENIDKSIGLQTHLAERELSAAIEKIILNVSQITIVIQKSKVADVGTECINIDLTNTRDQRPLLQEYLQTIFARSSVLIEYPQ
ncbi:hypothetical protein HV213_11735 [Klebsiella sp. RHBSTW-00484]|uniref:hypothetical protein n=1 Tax=unclassified Klebsiella TaxID=2608929 RepID=UPI0015E4DD99|nr:MULTISPECIES: hypothetical protein [unclassified Klebsiella]MBA7847680.1 hypothetical protein [Klebsiella sp. RHBSTW-00465]QLO36453.1 hypothetical protein HV213_11735 [Klebsiella sp. RHBSTW-00484]QLT75971.1 hypothetical protein HV204_11735 [Klebsiella sp. RHBSTW-00464]